MTTTGTEVSTLMGVQNADNIAVTGGSMAGVSITGGTITGATMTGTTITQPSGYVGTLTLNGTTPVTVSGSAILITSAIILSLNTVGGTVGVQPHVATISAGQFTVLGTASDSSIYNWSIIKGA